MWSYTVNTLLLEFLKNILTEATGSEISKKAADMGLEPKTNLGINIFGPIGGNVGTHRSADGELVPLKGDKPAKGKSNSPDSTEKSPQQLKKPKPPKPPKQKPSPPLPPETQQPVAPENIPVTIKNLDGVTQANANTPLVKYLENIVSKDDYYVNRVPENIKTKKGLKFSEVNDAFNEYVTKNEITDVDEFLKEIVANNIDLLPIIRSGSKLSHGNFVKFMNVPALADKLGVDTEKNFALNNLLPEYLRFFSPSTSEFVLYDTLEHRRMHLEHFLGKDGKGSKAYFQFLNNKITDIIFKEKEIALYFPDKNILYDILEKTVGFTAPRLPDTITKFKNIILVGGMETITDLQIAQYTKDLRKYNTVVKEAEAAWKAANSENTSLIKKYSDLKKQVNKLMFPPESSEDDQENAEEKTYTDTVNELKKLLKGLENSEGKKIYSRGKVENIIRTISDGRTVSAQIIGKKTPYLNSLSENFEKSIDTYKSSLSNIAERIGAVTNPTSEDFNNARVEADMALQELFSLEIPENITTTEAKNNYTKILKSLFAKLAESHEFFSEMLNGEEVYLPEYGGFPCGDKIRVERNVGENNVQYVKVERISVKTGENEEKTGAQSEFGKYPFWEGVYKDLGLGVMGWQNAQPFQFPREYADNPENFQEVLKDALVSVAETDNHQSVENVEPIFNDGGLSGNAEDFRKLVVRLQAIATENSNEKSHLTPNGKNKIAKNFPGDKRLRAYLSSPEDDESSLSPSQRIFREMKKAIGNEFALARDSVSLSDDKQSLSINNNIHKGDSYIGYMIESLLAACGDDNEGMQEILQFVGNKDNYITKQGKRQGSTGILSYKHLDIPKVMTNVSKLILPKYFNLENLRAYVGDQNYSQCLERGPMYVMAALVASGALKKHNGFRDVVKHRHYILNTTKQAVKDKQTLKVREYVGVPDIRDWQLKLDLFQSREDHEVDGIKAGPVWGLSNHNAGFGASVRINSKGRGKYNSTGKFRIG
jgi:hypothetical protein